MGRSQRERWVPTKNLVILAIYYQTSDHRNLMAGRPTANVRMTRADEDDGAWSCRAQQREQYRMTLTSSTPRTRSTTTTRW